MTKKDGFVWNALVEAAFEQFKVAFTVSPQHQSWHSLILVFMLMKLSVMHLEGA
jgi:hypothetical protein